RSEKDAGIGQKDLVQSFIDQRPVCGTADAARCTVRPKIPNADRRESRENSSERIRNVEERDLARSRAEAIKVAVGSSKVGACDYDVRIFTSIHAKRRIGRRAFTSA